MLCDDGDFTSFGRGPGLTAKSPMNFELRPNLELGMLIEIVSDVWTVGGANIGLMCEDGSKTVIEAGSVVTRDIPDGEFAAGNRCRVIERLWRSDLEVVCCRLFPCSGRPAASRTSLSSLCTLSSFLRHEFDISGLGRQPVNRSVEVTVRASKIIPCPDGLARPVGFSVFHASHCSRAATRAAGI